MIIEKLHISSGIT